MEALTALQWAKEGYVPNADAIGNERWTNCHHAQKATYYKTSEVHENADAAREIIKLNRKEYNQASKKREEKRKKAIAFRELMKQSGSGSRKVGYRIRMHGGNMARL